jgi:hypothetical protein
MRCSPNVGEEKDLEDRHDEEAWDHDPRGEPTEEGPVAHQPADEEDSK